MSNSNGEDTKVATFLGTDIYFNARKGKFFAYLNGGVEVESKTIDEVEKAIAERFRPRSVVRVLNFFLSSYDKKMAAVKIPLPIQITGFEVDRGRGRGATKTLLYTTTGGEKQSIGRQYKRWDSEKIQELTRLKAEFDKVEAEYFAKAKALVESFETITAEQILEELTTPPPPTPIRQVVQDPTFDVNALLSQALGNSDSDSDSDSDEGESN